MKFIVSRTEAYGDDTRPCAEAQREEHLYTHIRTYKSFEEFDTRHGARENPWLSKGSNHRVFNDPRYSHKVIAREEPRDTWVVEIESLAALAEFCNNHGRLIIERSDFADVEFAIEIYDGYRE